ncbi:MAG TPA: Fe-S-containing protein [Candidatus Dormibacteraeota bacterium]|nr:Fe-S-containing protein [Candidatus Dormibacteraeota bacterium]
MLSAFLIALREGVEASLVVGIVLVYLTRTGRARLTSYVWAGVALAAAMSLGVAIALERWRLSQDGFEGLLLLIAAFFVVSMLVWMNRIARRLKKEIEERVETFAARATTRSAGIGLLLFVFLMVLREGVEMAIILRAVQLSSEGLGTGIGTLLGLAAAVSVGLFFFKGTLRVPLPRFFAVTSTILILVAFQLALTGLHELSEARWLPSSKQEMALIGPIVRNEVFFFVFILGAAALLVLREWIALSQSTPATPSQNDAQARRREWDRRRQRRWMFAAAVACLAVVLALAADFINARASSASPQARTVTPQGQRVRIPVAEVSDGNLHFFNVDLQGSMLRFLVIRKPTGWGTALDACRICGAVGYRQDGSSVICRHCASAIYTPTIGAAGGCNPVGVPSTVEGDDLVLDLSALAQAASEVPK